MRFSLKQAHYWPLSTCTISRKNNKDFLSYSQKKHFDPRFDPFLPHISRTRFFPDMRFSLKEAHYWPLSTCRISRKNNEDFLSYSQKTPFWPPFDPRFAPYLEKQICSGLHTLHTRRVQWEPHSGRKLAKSNEKFSRNNRKSLLGAFSGSQIAPYLENQIFPGLHTWHTLEGP